MALNADSGQNVGAHKPSLRGHNLRLRAAIMRLVVAKLPSIKGKKAPHRAGATGAMCKLAEGAGDVWPHISGQAEAGCRIAAACARLLRADILTRN